MPSIAANPIGSLPQASGPRPLYQRFPRLDRTLPYVALAALPTPVTEASEALRERVGASTLHIKRDDLTGALYGGNKVRKLELLIADALGQRKAFLKTYGGLGSHHCLATALYGLHFGFASRLFLMPQPVTEHVRRNLRALAATGAEMHLASTLREVPVTLGRQLLKDWMRGAGSEDYTIPLGGSSPLGCVGFVNAGLELAQQVEDGALPAPEQLYVALGSGGTVAGLLIGLALGGLHETEVVAVRVVDRLVGTESRVRGLVKKTLALLESRGLSLNLDAVLAHPLRVEHGAFGEGYGAPTAEASRAVREVEAEMGVALETTYTGKTFAALLSAGASARDRRVLFWNTYNGASIERWVSAREPRSLPDAYHALFDEVDDA